MSGYHEWLNRKPSTRETDNSDLLIKIRQLHEQHKRRYGSPRIHAALVKQGIQFSRGRVERLMKAHDLVATRSKRHRRIYVQRESQQASPNLLAREFSASRPNEKWVSDITFIPTR